MTRETETGTAAQAPGARTRPRGERRLRTTRGPNPTDELVGSRLRQARLLRGLSQEELGTAIGVSFQAVQKYECGKNRLSAGRLAAAARFLDIPLAFLFQDEPHSMSGLATIGFTPDEIELIRRYRSIRSEDRRDHMLKLAKMLGEGDTVDK